MITCTTMVLLILVETTRPILVLRLPVFCSVVSAIYFFLALAVALFFFAGFAALPLAAVFFELLAAAFFGAAAEAASEAEASAPGRLWLGATMPSCFSRTTVCMRATS